MTEKPYKIAKCRPVAEGRSHYAPPTKAECRRLFINDDWIVDLKSETELVAEDGSVVSGFWRSEMIDSEGKVIGEPVCAKCGSYKNFVIGRSAFGSICMNGCENA